MYVASQRDAEYMYVAVRFLWVTYVTESLKDWRNSSPNTVMAEYIPTVWGC